MVVPTRSQNSSWHSLWDLQGTQAPQIRQSNNTLGGLEMENYFDELKPSVMEKIRPYIKETSSLGYMPKEHQGWFRWWCISNVDLPLSKVTIAQCMEAAKRDGVITDKLKGHLNISNVTQFMSQKVKNIKKSLQKSVSFKVWCMLSEYISKKMDNNHIGSK